MRPLPPGLPPHIATSTISFQQSLQQRQGLDQLGLSQQDVASGQSNLAQTVVGPGTGGLNRMMEVIRRLRIAFVVVRFVVITVVLWITWQIFAPY